jgi:hypothetical protein
LRIVRRAYFSENSAPNACAIVGRRRRSTTCFSHAADSCTP